MAIIKAKPKNFSPEQLQKLSAAAQQQSLVTVVENSTDPDNFPVHEIPINKDIMVYIPNHQVIGDDGKAELRMSKPYLHQVVHGRQYSHVRCSSGLADETLKGLLGYDGTCPICDGLKYTWDLYNKQMEAEGKSRGIDPKSEEAKEALKEVRRGYLNKRVAREAEQWCIFPIVELERGFNADGKFDYVLCKDEATQKTILKGRIVWYRIRKASFDKAWLPGLKTAVSMGEDVPANPAGFFGTLDYTYSTKDVSGDKNAKRDSAKSLKVGYSTISAVKQKELRQILENTRDYYDKLSEGWTPAKADETVILANWYDMAELTSISNMVYAPVKETLAMFNVTSHAIDGPVNQSAQEALESFGGSNAGVTDAQGASMGVFPAE